MEPERATATKERNIRCTTVYGAIDNLADKIMPVIPSSPVVMTIFDAPYRDDVYDGFGRVWRAGVRWKF